MTETPTYDHALELARQWGDLQGSIDGRRAALSLVRAEAYLEAFHSELIAAGLCDCPDEPEPDVQVTTVDLGPLHDLFKPLRDMAERLNAKRQPEAGRAAEANQGGAGETKACPCDQFCPDGERCDGLTTREAVARLNAEQRDEERLCPGCPDCIPTTDGEPSGRHDAPETPKSTAWCGNPDHDDPCGDCDTVLTDAADALRQRMPTARSSHAAA